MKYCTIKEAANRWGVSEQLVRRYCRQNRIPGLTQENGAWLIPAKAKKPQPINAPPAEDVSPLVRQIKYQCSKNNHFCEAHDNKTDYFIVEFNDPVAGLTKRVACDMVTLVKEISANEEICYKAYFDFSDSYDLSEDAFRRMQQQLFSSWMLFDCMPEWERERYFASLDLFNRVCGPEY